MARAILAASLMMSGMGAMKLRSEDDWLLNTFSGRRRWGTRRGDDSPPTANLSIAAADGGTCCCFKHCASFRVDCVLFAGAETCPTAAVFVDNHWRPIVDLSTVGLLPWLRSKTPIDVSANHHHEAEPCRRRCRRDLAAGGGAGLQGLEAGKQSKEADEKCDYFVFHTEERNSQVPESIEELETIVETDIGSEVNESNGEREGSGGGGTDADIEVPESIEKLETIVETNANSEAAVAGEKIDILATEEKLASEHVVNIEANSTEAKDFIDSAFVEDLTTPGNSSTNPVEPRPDGPEAENKEALQKAVWTSIDSAGVLLLLKDGDKLADADALDESLKAVANAAIKARLGDLSEGKPQLARRAGETVALLSALSHVARHIEKAASEDDGAAGPEAQPGKDDVATARELLGFWSAKKLGFDELEGDDGKVWPRFAHRARKASYAAVKALRSFEESELHRSIRDADTPLEPASRLKARGLVADTIVAKRFSPTVWMQPYITEAKASAVVGGVVPAALQTFTRELTCEEKPDCEEASPAWTALALRAAAKFARHAAVVEEPQALLPVATKCLELAVLVAERSGAEAANPLAKPLDDAKATMTVLQDMQLHAEDLITRTPPSDAVKGLLGALVAAESVMDMDVPAASAQMVVKADLPGVEEIDSASAAVVTALEKLGDAEEDGGLRLKELGNVAALHLKELRETAFTKKACSSLDTEHLDTEHLELKQNFDQISKGSELAPPCPLVLIWSNSLERCMQAVVWPLEPYSRFTASVNFPGPPLPAGTENILQKGTHAETFRMLPRGMRVPIALEALRQKCVDQGWSAEGSAFLLTRGRQD